MQTPTHRSSRPSQHRPQARRPIPPPPSAPPISGGDEIAPGQVWAGLSPALQAEMRQRALRILREVADDVR